MYFDKMVHERVSKQKCPLNGDVTGGDHCITLMKLTCGYVFAFIWLICNTIIGDMN